MSDNNGYNSLERFEKALIEKTLKSEKYNKTKTSLILDMSRKTLYAKMKKYGINS